VSRELEGKVAIVTGGSSGIGKGSVRRFVEEGARVVIADVDVEAGEALARELGADAAFCRTDVAQGSDVENAVAFAVSRFGGLDIMFNNAGISDPFAANSLLDRDFSDFDRIVRVVLLGVMLGTKFAARHMVQNGGGAIINTASTGGVEGGPGPPVYRAAKAGVINFTESAASELGPWMVRVNAISPGPIETPILLGGVDLPPDQVADQILATHRIMAKGQAIPRLGQPEDIGNAAVFLASDRAAQITGHNLVVSGGKAGGVGKKIGRPQEQTAEGTAT
jgi:NAD(P)-dependent dehydrogenase (short-subunit alcohol dehydrogenase family)